MTPSQIERINELAATEIMGWRIERDELGNPFWRNDSGNTRYLASMWDPRQNIAQAMKLAMKLMLPTVRAGGGTGLEIEMDGHTGIRVKINDAEYAGGDNFSAEEVAGILTLACLKAAGVDTTEFENQEQEKL